MEIAEPDSHYGFNYNSDTKVWEVEESMEDYTVIYVSRYGATEYAKWIGGAFTKRK